MRDEAHDFFWRMQEERGRLKPSVNNRHMHGHISPPMHAHTHTHTNSVHQYA